MITGCKDWGSSSCCACYDQPLHLAGHHIVVVVAGLHDAVDTGHHLVQDAVDTCHHLDDHDDRCDFNYLALAMMMIMLSFQLASQVAVSDLDVLAKEKQGRQGNGCTQKYVNY